MPPPLRKKRLEPDILTDCLLYTLIVLEPKSINVQVYDMTMEIKLIVLEFKRMDDKLMYIVHPQ